MEEKLKLFLLLLVDSLWQTVEMLTSEEPTLYYHYSLGMFIFVYLEIKNLRPYSSA